MLMKKLAQLQISLQISRGMNGPVECRNRMEGKSDAL